MLKEKYLQWLKDTVAMSLRDRPSADVFLFGSSVQRKQFGDMDIGVQGVVEESDLARLKENLNESTFPYTVDVINFNTVSDRFRNNVFAQPIVWIKR